jgi:hypothetical protein
MNKLARWLGYTLQALVLGILLALACVELIAKVGGAALFRYQGF